MKDDSSRLGDNLITAVSTGFIVLLTNDKLANELLAYNQILYVGMILVSMGLIYYLGIHRKN